MIRFKSFTHSPQPALFLALLLIATFGAACSGASPSSSSSSASGGGAFEGEITTKTYIGDQTMETLYAIKGARNRVETRFAEGSALAGVMETDVMLMDLSSGVTTMLFPQTKTYETMKGDETDEEMTQDALEDLTLDFTKLTSNGKTETIAGVTCEHWLSDNKMDLCLAKGLGYFSGGGSNNFLDNLKNLAMRDKVKAKLDANPEFAKFADGGVFPLRMAIIENGQSKTLMEVIKVERKSLDDSLFTVPADYKKTEAPEFQAVPGEKR